MAKVQNDMMDKLVALCKGRGFVFPGSEIYGGLANSWDYGPLGVEFKNNVKRAWWKKFVQESKYNVGIDCAILMNRQVWVASGHVGNFNDPLMDCKACKARFRADKLIEDWAKANGEDIEADGWTNEQLEAFIEEKNIPCPTCGKHDFTGIRKFNMMFKTHQGVTEDASNEIYLRPETAQGIFVNFPNVARTTRRRPARRTPTPTAKPSKIRILPAGNTTKTPPRASTSRRITRSMATVRAAVSRFQAAKHGRPPRSLTTKPPCPSP